MPYHMMVLGWSEDGGGVVFSVDGLQFVGLHLGEKGWWVALAPVSGGPVEEVAFTQPDPYGWDRYPQMSRDRRYIYTTAVREAGNQAGGEGTRVDRQAVLIRISLADGTITEIAGYGPAAFTDSMLWSSVTLSPGCTAAMWLTRDFESYSRDVLTYELLDLHNGKRGTVKAQSEWGPLEADRWTPDGQPVLICADSYIFGDDYADPNSAKALIVYDIGGDTLGVLKPQGGEDHSLCDWAWSPDGEALAYTEGPVTYAEYDTGHSDPISLAHELWTWNRTTGRCCKLAELTDLSAPERRYLGVRWLSGSRVCVFTVPDASSSIPPGLPIRVWLADVTETDGAFKAETVRQCSLDSVRLKEASPGGLLLRQTAGEGRCRMVLARPDEAGLREAVVMEGTTKLETANNVFREPSLYGDYLVVTDRDLHGPNSGEYLIVAKLPGS